MNGNEKEIAGCRLIFVFLQSWNKKSFKAIETEIVRCCWVLCEVLLELLNGMAEPFVFKAFESHSEEQTTDQTAPERAKSCVN